MSGIGKLRSTHNITERLYLNLWDERSEKRNSTDVMSPLLGDGAMMAGPDYAHWHGFFKLQLAMYKLQGLYEKRIKSGKIED